VLIIIAFLLTMVAVPLSTQIKLRRAEETKRLLEQAKEALLGFAMANGRFPCPARFVSIASHSQGLESFCVAAAGTCVGTETTVFKTHGNCSNFYNGFLPAATLGLSPLDAQGFLRDGWGTELNRIRYAVSDQTVVVVHPFTVSVPNGMQSATLTNLGSADYLYICASGTGTTATTCGTAATLTSKAPIVLISLGANAPTPSASGDEPLNVDGGVVFVSHEESGAGTATAFDDIVTWISINAILSKMVAAGRLP
jgi:type II secretory pathway pseudopilin PulG